MCSAPLFNLLRLQKEAQTLCATPFPRPPDSRSRQNPRSKTDRPAGKAACPPRTVQQPWDCQAYFANFLCFLRPAPGAPGPGCTANAEPTRQAKQLVKGFFCADLPLPKITFLLPQRNDRNKPRSGHGVWSPNPRISQGFMLASGSRTRV